jgi:hypothetical protein
MRLLILAAFTVLHTQMFGCVMSSGKECNTVLKLLFFCLRCCSHVSSSLQ